LASLSRRALAAADVLLWDKCIAMRQRARAGEAPPRRTCDSKRDPGLGIDAMDAAAICQTHFSQNNGAPHKSFATKKIAAPSHHNPPSL
jgi:hypothetical protein